MRRAVPFTVVIWGWLSMPALAVDAAALLNKVDQAERQTSFTGTFVYGVAGGLLAHEVWHVASDGQVRERFFRLDGEPAEVVRVDGAIECTTDEFASEVASKSGWQASQVDARALQEGYHLRSLGDSRVAGRSVDAVAITPRDQHRYGFELYLDKQTGVPLKTLMLGEAGQLLQRYQYTHFNPSELAQSAIEPAGNCARRPSAKMGEAAGSPVSWAVEWVPPGFRQLAAGSRQASGGDTLTWLSYGDGLAKFTAFVEPATVRVPTDERTQLGPTSAVSKRVTGGAEDVMVTVVGEIPLGTAERIALSVRAQPEQRP